MAIGSLLMWYSPTIGILIVGRFIAGLGFGAEALACNVYLAETSPIRYRGAIIATYMCSVVLG